MAMTYHEPPKATVRTRGVPRRQRAVAREGAPTKGLLLGLVGLLGAPGAAFGIDIQACGQEVPRDEVAELRSDLHCGPVGPAVLVGPRATLNLNGFTIMGPGTGGNAGVECSSRRCTINGPGEIRGFAAGIGGGGARVTGVTLRFNTQAGIVMKGGVLELSNVTASDNGIGVAVAGAGRVRARDVVASGNDTGMALPAGATKLLRVSAVKNGTGGGLSFRGGRGRLVDSTILGNDGLGEGYDVLTDRPLRVRNSVCGRGARVRVMSRPPYTTTVLRPLRGCGADQR